MLSGMHMTNKYEELNYCGLQACKCAGISGNFAQASPHALEALIIIIIIIHVVTVVFGMHENMNGT